MHTKTILFFFVAAILLGQFAPTATAQTNAISLRDSIDIAVNAVKPALVRIHVVSSTFRGGREQKFIASGSGVIITRDGHVVTNHHVAGLATRIKVTLSNREEMEAELIGTDPLTDIAVIRLLPEDHRQFDTAEFGDSTAVRVGDHVMSMGSPLALSQSVTLGIVSNTDMVMPKRMGFRAFQLDGEDVGSLVKWIAHDAVIYGGNSGGPLVNLEGKIIGINEISMGLGGAIPGNLARQVAREIIEDGQVSRSWLGITTRPLFKHGDHDRGVFIADAIEDSPAADAGFESGDILIELAGKKVNVRFDEELPAFNRHVAEIPVGATVEAIVVRNGEEKTLSLTTALRERVRHKQREFRQWGLTARDLSFVMAKEMKRADRSGAIVTSVRPGGPANEAKPAINRGDVIVEVGGITIINTDDLARLTKELTLNADGLTPVLATFERRGENLVTVVKLGIREFSDPGREVKKAWLPVRTQVITRDIADLAGRDDLRGFRVTRLYTDAENDGSGLEVGDFIVAADGEALTASVPEDYEELPALIRGYRVDSVVDLTVLRNGESLTVSVKLPQSPRLDREMHKYRELNFEFTARDITFFDKAGQRWDENESGALVEDVVAGGWANLGALYVGDLLQEIDGRSVRNVEDLEAVMKEVAAEAPASIVFQVLRGIYSVYLEFEPKWDDVRPD